MLSVSITQLGYCFSKNSCLTKQVQCKLHQIGILFWSFRENNHHTFLFLTGAHCTHVSCRACVRREQGGHDPLPGESVKHLNDNEGGQGHGWRMGVVKDVTVHPLEALILNQALRLMGLQTTTRLMDKTACSITNSTILFPSRGTRNRARPHLP